MGEVTTAEIDKLRDEMLDVRREVREVRRLMEANYPPLSPRPTKDEALAGLEEARRLRDDILRRRGGRCLPSAADEIAAARKERTASLLGGPAE